MKLHKILVAVLTVLIIFVGVRFYDILSEQNDTNDNEISSVILSLEDNFDKNDYWSGTFNLLWNTLTDDLDVSKISNTSKKNEKIIANLNRKTFNKNNISSSSYYNNHGYATGELKKKIEKDLKKKFNTTSNILDNFSWDGNTYFIYSMLYKEFKFKYKFEELDKENFKTYENVEYFGIRKSNKDELRKQVKVLYYQDINNFVIKLITNSNDEIILARGVEGNNFLSIYDNIKKLEDSYTGSEEFSDVDQLKIPVLDFHYNEEIDELGGIELETKIDTVKIDKIIRDTTFKLDATGGKLKDEVGMSFGTTSVSHLDKNSRLFYLTSDFNLFLIEKGKDLPYFAINVSDISKFQKLS